MRVFLIQLASKRWTLYTEKSEFLLKSAIDFSANSSSSATATATNNVSTTGRISNLIQYLKDKASESKQEIDNAVEGEGIKGKMKTLLRKLDDRIHPEEPIMHQFSKLNENNLFINHGHSGHNHSHNHNHSNSSHNHNNPLEHHPKMTSTQMAIQKFHDQHQKPVFTINYPASLGERRAMRYAHIVVRQRTQYHKFWASVNVALIPLTAAATILPGPNVFLAWNLYRLYSHLMAVKGGLNLLKLSKQHNKILYKENQELEQSLLKPQPQQQQTISSTSTSTTTETINNLSTSAKIPGLFEYIKKIEGCEKKQLIAN